MDQTLKGSFRGHVGYGISLMVKKYFKSTPKAEELLKMLEENVNNSKLRIVAEFEDNYARQVFERKMAEKKKFCLSRRKLLLRRMRLWLKQKWKIIS